MLKDKVIAAAIFLICMAVVTLTTCFAFRSKKKMVITEVILLAVMAAGMVSLFMG